LINLMAQSKKEASYWPSFYEREIRATERDAKGGRERQYVPHREERKIDAKPRRNVESGERSGQSRIDSVPSEHTT